MATSLFSPTPRRGNRTTRLRWHLPALLLALSALTRAEPLVQCTPRTLSGLPGEPLQATIRVETERAIPVEFIVPAHSNLVVRTRESIPIQRAQNGRYVQRQLVVWQGLNSGEFSIPNLSIKMPTNSVAVPEIRFKLRAVSAAPIPIPPKKQEPKQ